MTNIRAVDMLFLDDLLKMGGGNVLNFSDRTFAHFFAEELNIDIDSAIYRKNGSSKGKRLRCFLQAADKPTVIKSLQALWEYREAVRERAAEPEQLKDAHARLASLIERLHGVADRAPAQPVSPKPDTSQLLADLLALSRLEPQPRGYAFEKFLRCLFNVYGLEARAAFRLCGEQIDGSLQLANETYLLEAKWQALPCGVADLRAFQGKIEERAAWTRGLFISNSGFSDDGLTAFGRGKRVICMDGFDLSEALTRNIPLTSVFERKTRRAAETGEAFIRVRDLFPY
jgi:hypothetical protein